MDDIINQILTMYREYVGGDAVLRWDILAEKLDVLAESKNPEMYKLAAAIARELNDQDNYPQLSLRHKYPGVQ